MANTVSRKEKRKQRRQLELRKYSALHRAHGAHRMHARHHRPRTNGQHRQVTFEAFRSQLWPEVVKRNRATTQELIRQVTPAFVESMTVKVMRLVRHFHRHLHSDEVHDLTLKTLHDSIVKAMTDRHLLRPCARKLGWFLHEVARSLISHSIEKSTRQPKTESMTEQEDDMTTTTGARHNLERSQVLHVASDEERSIRNIDASTLGRHITDPVEQTNYGLYRLDYKPAERATILGLPVEKINAYDKKMRRLAVTVFVPKK